MTSTPPSRDQTFYHLDATLPNELKYALHSLLVRHGRGCVRCAASGVTTQDFVEHCPIEDLIVRGKNGKRKGGSPKKKPVKVENDEGTVVGSIKEDESGHVEIDVKDGIKEELGERNESTGQQGGDGNEVAVEEEIEQKRRPTRSSAKNRSSRGIKREESLSEPDDVKPVPKRPRAKRGASSTLDDALPKTKRASRSAANGKRAMEHSVDRDEAEMSGRAWTQPEGAMHGLDG